MELRRVPVRRRRTIGPGVPRSMPDRGDLERLTAPFETTRHNDHSDHRTVEARPERSQRGRARLTSTHGDTRRSPTAAAIPCFLIARQHAPDADLRLDAGAQARGQRRVAGRKESPGAPLRDDGVPRIAAAPRRTEAIARRVKPGSSFGTDAQPGRCSSPRGAAARLPPWRAIANAGGPPESCEGHAATRGPIAICGARRRERGSVRDRVVSATTCLQDLPATERVLRAPRTNPENV